jgi:hypothetical protein
MRAERRSPTIWPRVSVNQQWEEPMPEAKPYDNVESARPCTGWAASRDGTPRCSSCGSSA